MQGQVTTLFSRPSRRHFLATAIATTAIGISLISIPAQAGETSMSAQDAYKGAQTGEIILVDIRTPEEWRQTGIGEGAIALDMRTKTFVQSLVTLRETYPEKPIALICRTGNRSGYVFNALNQQGFAGLADVSEGMAGGRNGKGWIAQGLPVYPGNKDKIEMLLKAVMTP